LRATAALATAALALAAVAILPMTGGDPSLFRVETVVQHVNVLTS